MSRIERFEDLIAWQRARSLAASVYRESLQRPISRDFVFADQIRRAALSVPSNIAEGFERARRPEFHQFLSIAKSSCAELRSHIYIASDIGYLNEDRAAELLSEAEEVSRIVGGLRRAVERQKRTQSSVLSPQS